MSTALLATLAETPLVFTVTSGRSGTKLLTTLLRDSLGINAEHEPAPRLNFVMRSMVRSPDAVRPWLETEKLPAIRDGLTGDVYVETSHLWCKGFIETLVDLGLKLKFIILSRPSTEVAQSLFRMNVIPERTSSGNLVLLGPSDPGVLKADSWQSFDDYQLCYWYALEIERRQRHYQEVFDTRNIGCFAVEMTDLLDWKAFTRLCAFIKPDATPDRAVFDTITAKNQNPRGMASGRPTDRFLPNDLPELEQGVREAVELMQG